MEPSPAGCGIVRTSVSFHDGIFAAACAAVPALVSLDHAGRHTLLLTVWALIGDERQRDEDDRGLAPGRPVILAGWAFEPVIMGDLDLGMLRGVADLLAQPILRSLLSALPATSADGRRHSGRRADGGAEPRWRVLPNS